MTRDPSPVRHVVGRPRALQVLLDGGPGRGEAGADVVRRRRHALLHYRVVHRRRLQRGPPAGGQRGPAEVVLSSCPPAGLRTRVPLKIRTQLNFKLQVFANIFAQLNKSPWCRN